MKKLSDYIIEKCKLCTSEQYNPFKLSDEEKRTLINLDFAFGQIAFEWRQNFQARKVTNLDEEWEKFQRAYTHGIKYFPILEIDYNPEYEGLEDRILDLLRKFQKFPCILSKYYIQLLQTFLRSIQYHKDKHTHAGKYQTSFVPHSRYQEAIEILTKHPHVEVELKSRNRDANYAQKFCQNAIDELGFGYKVEITDKILPRMSVDVNGKMYISKTAVFSDDDLEGLRKHEIEGHIARRYYGYQLGLYIMVIGLPGRNSLDEGLAVWQSLHEVDRPKENVKWNIALKMLCAYLFSKQMDFVEVFNEVKHLLGSDFTSGRWDKLLFKTLCRFKREIQDTSILGASMCDTAYLRGYDIVKEMTDEERDIIKKYNIGKGQLHCINDIKKFFEINKFESLPIGNPNEI